MLDISPPLRYDDVLLRLTGWQEMPPPPSRTWLCTRLLRLRYIPAPLPEAEGHPVRQLLFDRLPERSVFSIVVFDADRTVFQLDSILDGSHELLAGEMFNAICASNRQFVPALDLDTTQGAVTLTRLQVRIDLLCKGDAPGAVERAVECLKVSARLA